ncbi:zinc transport system substrate-binding protein [Loktanella fryxellensis]|uniref:High-affinity zinc uptake system protein ZnuA n=1 Tax=Loktanella fryxellensis TaxID=245187 RepID=A0A1H8AIH1_9RHOB|nr:zinc ABC transporter substrate-binding protein [Loktanella fryxellensis]SEM70333.1 zinc transport system substrate-binding protein [Loktanella fryxellensis]
MTRTLCTAALLSAFASAAHADAPRVVADIAPIHSLTAQVMDGIATPDLIVPPGADAHHMALRPSDARVIAGADVVIWVGPEMTPWLDEPLTALAPEAASLVLMRTPGWTPREVAADDDHGDGAHAGHHHATDPHAWLDPEVAAIWVAAIRDTLTAADPDNAATYAANADRAIADLTRLRGTIAATLSGVPAGSWAAPHAAFGYFEDRFMLASAGAISDSDDIDPGPAHLATLRDRVAGGEITCVLSQTGATTDYVTVLTEGTAARTGTIDDTGIGLTPGPALHAALLTGIAATLKDCIAPQG